MKKRGTHVGMIISFAIFITFLLFLVIILEPALEAEEEREIYLDYLQKALEQRFLGEMNTFTINATIESGQDCLSLKDFVPIIEAQGLDPTNLIIKNENDEILTYTFGNKDLQIDTGSTYRGFIKIFYSDDFDNSYCPLNPAQCGITGCNPAGDFYTIEIIRMNNESFEPRIQEIVDFYLEDYEGLKESLSIPEGLEFEFSLVFENNEGHIIEASQPLPENQDIYVEEIPILYIDEWGNLKPGTLILKIWGSV